MEREHAPYEDLPGQLDMWKDYATPACNSVRAKNKPDTDGFFDAAGTTEICGRRQCNVEFASEYAAKVAHKTKTVPLTAIGPGKWDPVSILKACSEACGRPSFDVNVMTAKPINPRGLDEIKIARIVGADGIRPYLTRRRKYGLWPDRSYCQPTTVMFVDNFALVKTPRAEAGNPTWVFRAILCGTEDRSNYGIRRGLRALEDVGLVDVKLGPRGGMATAKLSWTARAYLPVPKPRPVAFERDDDIAIECIALGIA
jgi:hypothetical protein